MHLILHKLPFIHGRLIKHSSHSCLLPIRIHLCKIILINNLDRAGGIDGEHLLNPVFLEVEVGGASDEREEAGELGGVLRGVEALELRDEGGVDDVGQDLVGNFLLA